MGGRQEGRSKRQGDVAIEEEDRERVGDPVLLSLITEDGASSERRWAGSRS